MQKVTWILFLLWNQTMILSLEEKTCEASNWISFTYYLFWGDFEANDEHARSWELLAVYSAYLSLLERMLRGNRARLSVNCLVSFQLHSASQLISCAIRIDQKIMQQCTGKWGPILCHGSVLHIRWECSYIVRKDYNVCILRIISVCVIE